jgi:membrane-bound lytic murein transglycosylase B
MSKRFKGLLAAVMAASFSLPVLAVDNYADHPKAQEFVEKMVSEHGFERAYVQHLVATAERKQSILDAMSRPAEKTKEWKDYRKIFVTDTRAEQGREFMKTYAETLDRAERDFGVPREIITAIIGVETLYGKRKGSYKVVDALATLGFDYPPRSKFFTSELEQYLLLVREQKFDALAVEGSYAGAMGYGQFISSSYRHYAVDFDGDGIADIINNPVDAIGSVANYFKSHGWRQGELVTVAARVSDDYNDSIANEKLKPSYTVQQLREQGYRPASNIGEDTIVAPFRLMGEDGAQHWLGLQNFYVITRYNHSRLYAMAVYQLSEELK